MVKRPAVFRPSSMGTRVQAAKATELQRGSARERGYTTGWDKASKAHLQAHPLCDYHLLSDGRSVAATLTDHLYPHRQYEGVFWSRQWWVSCCAECHSSFKQAVERQGKGALDALARRLGREVLMMQKSERNQGDGAAEGARGG
jgi:5-methylcytosine-specific restriction protein A